MLAYRVSTPDIQAMASNSRAIIYVKFLILSAIFLIIFLAGYLITNALTSQNYDSSPDWASPSVKTIKNIGLSPTVLDRPNFQSNIDCEQITYRRVNYNDMETGCFVRSAYGLLNPDNELIIFNGTDEALPITPYLSHQVLTPSPNSTDTLSLNASITGGSYLGIYRNLVGVIEDKRNYWGELVAKNVTSAQEINLNNTDGSRLVINPQTMAYSSDGDWLVVETLNGTFVRINLKTLEIIAFAQSFGTLGSPALLKSHVAVSSDGRYVAIENNAAVSFKVYDLSTCQGDYASIKPLVCENYDYWPYVNTNFAGINEISHLQFINNGLLGFRAMYQGIKNSFELAPALEIKSLIDYLAVGDSYTSGEGAFDYLFGTDTDKNYCHLSIHSYPLLLTQKVYGGSGGHSVACSGAKIGDIFPSNRNKYKGQVRSGTAYSQTLADVNINILSDFMPGYLPQSDFAANYQPATITISVGGNDVGFADILRNCVMPHFSLRPSDQSCYNTYEDRAELKNLIDRTVSKWTLLFRRLKAVSPLSTINVVGYPQIFFDKGSCALNVQLNKNELEFSTDLTDYLNGSIAKSALLAKLNYIDISEALYGYRLCETAGNSVAVNGLTAGKDSGLLGLKIIGRESYHPSAFGHSLIANAILKHLSGLSIASSITPTTSTEQKFLDMPKSGRQILILIPTSDMTDQVIIKGGASPLTIDGTANGLRANTAYTITLDRNLMISSVVTNQSGDISTTFVLPPNTLIGGHMLDIVGSNQAGQIVDLTQPIFVASDDIDADEDAIINSSDSCPLAVNTGVDGDLDGIDDICDGFIGTAQGNNNGSNIVINSSIKNNLQTSGGDSNNQAVKVQKSDIKSPSIIASQNTSTVKNKQSYSASQPAETISKNDNTSVSPIPYRHLTLVNWLDSTWRLSLILVSAYSISQIIRQLSSYLRSKNYQRYVVRNSVGRGVTIGF